MNEINHVVERTGAGGSLAFRPPQPTGGRERRRALHLRHLMLGALALLASAGRLTPALGATGAGTLARPAGSKPCTGGVLNSQYWKVQAGDTVTVQITGAKDALPTSGTTVPVLIQSDLSLLGNVTVAGTLTGTPGTTRATVTFTWPYSMGPSCATSHIAYWGGSKTGFLFTNSALINGSKTTPAGWAIVDPACKLVLTNPLTGRCYPPLSSVQCPLQQGLLDCASGSSKYESFAFSPGGIVGGQPPYSVTASGTNGVTLAPAGGYSNLTLASNDLGFAGTFPAGQTTVTITVTDAVGASAQCSFAVTIDHPTVTVADAAVCAGYSTTLTAQPAGGSGPYRFSWSGPGGFTASGQTVSVSAAGQYTVTVTDSNRCQGQGSGSLTVNQPPVASIGGQTNVACNGGSNGSATVTVTGGTSPYTVSDGTSSQTGAGPFTFSSLAAKSYSYTVTDKNGCTATTSVTITQPPQLTVSIGGLTNVCVGYTVSATAAASGGTAPYSYSWSTHPVQIDATATGLAPGQHYTVTATDANGCTATATLFVPAPMDMRLDPAGRLSCYGGIEFVGVLVSGTPPYTVTDGTSSQTGTGPFSFHEPAGSYTFTVTDGNGCTASRSITLTQPPALTVSTTQTNVSCWEGNDGSATAQASGGTGPYRYSWDTDQVQTSATATGLTRGWYTVTATDANGCTATALVRIDQPERLGIAWFGDPPVSCHGGSDGSATVDIGGGTEPYSWSWDTTPAQTGTGATATATGLAAGDYTVTVTDKNGCTASRTVTIDQPAALDVRAGYIPPCVGESNGSATAFISGGTAPYSYAWNTNPVQTGATATGLAAGSYTVTVTDKNGCTASATTTFQETQLSVSISGQTNVSTYGGSDGTVNASISGDAPPFEYSWNTSPPQTGVYDTVQGAPATGLKAGTYTITVTNPYGCTATATVTITQPPPP